MFQSRKCEIFHNDRAYVGVQSIFCCERFLIYHLKVTHRITVVVIHAASELQFKIHYSIPRPSLTVLPCIHEASLYHRDWNLQCTSSSPGSYHTFLISNLARDIKVVIIGFKVVIATDVLIHSRKAPGALECRYLYPSSRSAFRISQPRSKDFQLPSRRKILG